MAMGEKGTVLRVAYDIEVVAAALKQQGGRSGLVQQLPKSAKGLHGLAEPWPATDG